MKQDQEFDPSQTQETPTHDAQGEEQKVTPSPQPDACQDEAIDIQNPQEELDALKDRLLRAMAETENLRRRSQRELEEARDYAIGSFAKDLLVLSDTFDKIFEALPEAKDPGILSFVQGLRLVRGELDTIFKRHGIQEVNPLHQPFDPHYHQALMHVQDEKVEENHVCSVMQVGFVLKDRLLRPALVSVSKGPTS